jgi:hypothetical protein
LTVSKGLTGTAEVVVSIRLYIISI